MLSRLAPRLVQANKLAIVPKRNFNGVLYQFGPPKNKLSPVVSLMSSFLKATLDYLYISILKQELSVMGVVFLVGILGPSFYLASTFKVINGRNKLD